MNARSRAVLLCAAEERVGTQNRPGLVSAEPDLRHLARGACSAGYRVIACFNSQLGFGELRLK